ncbi:MAG: hypothetical protein GXY83_39650 [Rhodopirellula sp.]|nr:hypothetical protein [Rhodopirellula sp.]
MHRPDSAILDLRFLGGAGFAAFFAALLSVAGSAHGQEKPAGKAGARMKENGRSICRTMLSC